MRIFIILKEIIGHLVGHHIVLFIVYFIIYAFHICLVFIRQSIKLLHSICEDIMRMGSVSFVQQVKVGADKFSRNIFLRRNIFFQIICMSNIVPVDGAGKALQAEILKMTVVRLQNGIVRNILFLCLIFIGLALLGTFGNTESKLCIVAVKLYNRRCACLFCVILKFRISYSA